VGKNETNKNVSLYLKFHGKLSCFDRTNNIKIDVNIVEQTVWKGKYRKKKKWLLVEN